MKITIIGAGNIGGATAMGLKATNELTVTARTRKTLEKFEESGFKTTLDNAEAVRNADIVIFAVKPWIMEEVVRSVVPSVDFSTTLIVSMAPGVKSGDILSWLPDGAKLAYVIPNTAIEFGESMTFIAPVTTTEKETALLKEIFDKAGETIVVSEKMLIPGTSLASCGIAYALRYIHAAAQGGVELGFFANDAVRIVSQTVRGASEILHRRGAHPEAEIDRVTTPGGMTIKGLNAMEDAGFSPAVIKGLKVNR